MERSQAYEASHAQQVHQEKQQNLLLPLAIFGITKPLKRSCPGTNLLMASPKKS
jgi:hypothetical protein